MNETLQPGISRTKEYRVEPENTVNFLGHGVPPILASCWMLLFMEHAAREAALPHLGVGEDTVGVGFEFQHLAPSPVGCKVIATATLTAIEGRSLHFAVEASDDHEVIGRGRHVRVVVQVSRFAERLRKKLGI